MNQEQLQAMGLTIRPEGNSFEAELELSSALINPLSQKLVDKVSFIPDGDRLRPVKPAEMVGLAPLAVAGLSKGSELEAQLTSAFDQYIFILQRRSEELQTLGLQPKVEPATLKLASEVRVKEYVFTIAADKATGRFRIGSVLREGKPLKTQLTQTFDLSEFREPQALGGYLMALVAEPVEVAKPETTHGAVLFDEIASCFGAGAQLPPRTPLEVLVTVKVNGIQYRFAAARVMGRTFRGLLAGPQGKLWADRFELEEFPGVAFLVARSLGVTADAVQIVPPEEE